MARLARVDGVKVEQGVKYRDNVISSGGLIATDNAKLVEFRMLNDALKIFVH